MAELQPGDRVSWRDGTVITKGTIRERVPDDLPLARLADSRGIGPWYRIDADAGGRYVLPKQRLQ